MLRILRVALSVCCTLAFLSGSVLATHWVVALDGSGSHRSVHAAMADAVSGDSVYVQPGVYEGHIEFVNGVTIIGAGAGHTILRHGFGFEEVLRARNVASGRLEGVTIERLPSILAAPAVVLDSATITLVNCTITGGQGAGVDVSGLSASPTLEGCLIEDNDGHGVWIHGSGEVTLRRTEISGNRLNGALCESAAIRLQGGEIAGNALSGLVVAGDASAEVSDTQLTTNELWGIEVHDDSTLEARSVGFHRNTSGALRMDGSAQVLLASVDIHGGGAGIRAEDGAGLTIRTGSIRDVRGSGVRVLDQATCEIVRLEVFACGDAGLELASSSATSILHSTIARNDGDGIHIQGGACTVSDTILSLNEGAGIRVEGTLSATSAFGHNNVWGNAAGDYIGLRRRASDLAQSPGFADPSEGDAALRAGSPCIGSGEWGETIGAAFDPLATTGADVTISLNHNLEPSAWTLGADLRLGLSLAALQEGRIGASADWRSIAARIDASLIGPAASWMAADVAYRTPEIRLSRDGSTRLSLAAGGDLMLDGPASYLSAWGTAAIDGATSYLFVRLEQEWPTRITRQRVDLEIGRWGLDVAATDLTAHRLHVSGDAVFDTWGGKTEVQGGLTLIPDPRATSGRRWTREVWALDARVAFFLDDPRFGSVELGWEDRDEGAGVRVRLDWAEFALSDLALLASWRIAEFDVSAELGLHTTHGPRFRLQVGLDTSGWFTTAPNEAPVARYASSPHEPEAGRAVSFDASASFDPDGAIDQIWWEFGDGGLAIGETVEYAFPASGEYSVTLTVSDDEGASTTIVESIVIWEADTAPVAVFTWSAVSEAGVPLARPPRVGDRLRLNATDSFDPDGAIVEYNWDLQSDGAFDVSTSEPFVLVDPFPAGSWPVTLRVIDDTDRSDAVMHVVHIDEPRPPLAGFELSPSMPSVLDPVRFLDRSVEGDEAIVAWEWEFGDGSASREREPIHRFEAESDYDVRLTVTDAAGRTGSHDQAVHVGRVPGIVTTEDVWALVIGISNYAEVEDLDYASRDAMALADWLSSTGVPDDHVRVLTDGEDGVFQSATLLSVREGLGWLRRQADEDDLVLVHFSGHGYQGADDNGDEADGVDEFLALQDTRTAARDDTALRDDEFGRFLDRIASNHVLVLFDSCYSGGLSRSLPPGARSTTDASDWLGDLKLEGRLVLSASAEGEEAFESPALEHGVFTHFLLQGLNGAADLNGDYRITLWELYEYVAAEVPVHVEAERNEPQHPQLRGEGETRVLLSLNRQPAEVALSYCPTIPYAGGTIRFTGRPPAAGPDVEWAWSFGDGETAIGSSPSHAYRDAGSYVVDLILRDGGTEIAARDLTIDVAPPGTVVALDSATETATLSLGLRNGVQVGNRFVAERTGVALEVIELVDQDRAICTVGNVDPDLQAGDIVRPTRETPCGTSPAE